jgi:hypothetical protein
VESDAEPQGQIDPGILARYLGSGRRMTAPLPRYQGGAIGHRDALRLAEPEMSDDEYDAYRVAWWKEFPCRCEADCLCQGPPPGRPRQARILVELPDEPPRLSPEATQALLRIILNAAGQERGQTPDPGH